MDAIARAAELCEEHDLHVVVVTVRGGVPADVHGRLLAEASAETRALLESEGRPIWWVEADEDASLFVVDALAMDLKERLVELEDDHPLGAWFNLDLMTEMPDGRRAVWHGSPFRPTSRLVPCGAPAQDVLGHHDWSVDVEHC